jgi:DNA-binding HxlR family transcriptional regulator
VSRGALRAALDALIEERLVERNPGFGHPLRPEYILTPDGERIGSACARFTRRLAREGAEEAVLRKWSGPLLLAARDGARHFRDLRAALPGVTDRALTLALKELGAAGLLERQVLAGYPPTTRYALTAAGREISASLHAIRRAIAL